MDTLLGAPCPDMRRMGPLDLAFVGDGIYDLLAREYLLKDGPCPVKKLHLQKTALVCCKAQARALGGLWEELSGHSRLPRGHGPGGAVRLALYDRGVQKGKGALFNGGKDTGAGL